MKNGRGIMKTIAMLACAIALAVSQDVAQAADVNVSVAPATPFIERGKSQQLLNCDFRIDNNTNEQIELSSVEVSVLGEADRLLAQYRVGANGLSVLVIPNRFVEPGKAQIVFNPLFAFPEDLSLKKMRFVFSFDVGDAGSKYRAEITVQPKAFQAGTKLRLPVDGAVLVHDGHDFYGHHRRLDMQHPMAEALGWKRNFMRFSYDFVKTDPQGRMFKGDGSRHEDWFGWGTAVVAPAAGKVVAARDGMPDNLKDKPPAFSREQFIADPSLMWGNHVVIDHGNNEYSLLAHLKQGSVAVREGQAIKAGEQTGAMGMSGDAFLVHLHYDLKSGPGFDAEGLPSPFQDFERLTGPGWKSVPQGQVDSGDIVRPRAGNQRRLRQ
jgi:murein DD-endopeptidase MepM/ murein hydrolase activator NlpD